ncbi:MAG: Rrf2 family transcriptional regulator [Bacteroidales bacterium]|jgi:Rrf2 family protein|nr:Rrf2 family transcriptional regulator [Bacteroidales bacterium]
MSKIVSLSEASSIALHGIILIARSNSNLNVIKIAEETGNSKHHVAKVMQRLVKEGFIESHRGPNGGFVLLKDPKEITFLEIYETIEGKIVVHECPMNKQICPFGKCIMKNLTNKLTLEFKEYLSKQTLDTYI